MRLKQVTCIEKQIHTVNFSFLNIKGNKIMCSYHMQVTKTNQLAFMDDIKEYLPFTAFSEAQINITVLRELDEEISDFIRNILFTPVLNQRFIETDLQHSGSRHL